jgi:hypothetical protein
MSPDERTIRTRFLIVALVVSAIVAGCGSTNHVDEERLAILERDPLATAQAPGTTFWKILSVAGSDHGIGFGGSSPTSLDVVRRLQGARSSVTRSYAQEAIRSGWRVLNIRCYGTYDVISSVKQFSGWTANVLVSVDFPFDGSYEGKRVVMLNFVTDSHERAASTLSPSAVGLSVPAIAQTCLGPPS